MINTIRTKTVIDLVRNRIEPVVNTDLDNTYHWEIADFGKEALGIQNVNLIQDYAQFPDAGQPGEVIRVDGKIYRWESDE